MKTVTIRYRPVSFFPAYRTITVAFPQNWGEITPSQLIAIACLYKNRISDLQFLNRMSGISMRILKRTSDYERYKLTELLLFVSDRKPFHSFIIKKLEAKTWRPEYFAPDDKLKAVTFGQFIFADTYFSNYQESQNEDDLNKFIAALYLRKRETFEEWMVIQRHISIGKIDRTIREAIAINYQLIHEWLTLAYPLIFQKREDMIKDAAVPELVEGRDPNIWIKIFQNFVGDDILHDDVWASKPINTIFAFMTRKYKENARKKSA